MLTWLVTAVGAWALVVRLWGLVSILYRYLAYSTDWPRKWGAEAGRNRWAVVTGCTDGIGREYAVQLAAKGYDVLLLGRSAEKLREVAGQLQAFGRRCDSLVVDFARATPADYERVGAALKDREVRVLVNNVGISYPFPEYLHLQTEEVLNGLLAINIDATVRMSRLVLPSMLERFRRDRSRSLIVNVGSFSRSGAPLLGAYAGSKGFVHALSTSIRSDYEPLGVDVVQFAPMFVATKMARVRPGLLTPSAARYVASTLKVMNDKSANGQAGYLFHDLIFFVLDMLPFGLVQNRSLAYHKSLRRRAYAKHNLQDPLSINSQR